jgi:ribonucleoside-diphosphate reductase alpha chain
VWEGQPEFDWDRLAKVVPVLVRMLDNVLDLTPWPLPEQEREAQAKRRIGVGFTGLGDTLIMLGLKYSSAEGREFARELARTIRNLAYEASVELAKERGAFPLFDAEKYLEKVTFASLLPGVLKERIRKHGIRNSHLLSLAPTGTGSLTFGNNCSSGCEPVFDFVQQRFILQEDGTRKVVELVDYAYLVYRELGGDTAKLPDYFESVATLTVADHLGMLKVLAPYVDAAISKTVNVPADYSFEDFKAIYIEAWKGGLKGVTTYRPNNEIGAVLVSSSDVKKQEDLDESDPDRRLKLTSVPETVLKSMRWLDRPHMPDGNPSHTYMVESPEGDFAVQIGHFVNGEVHPFEVWVNGAECPRGLGAIAKTLSADMRSYDRSWLNAKLEALQKCKGEPFEMPMPPDGATNIVPGAVSAMAWLVAYHCTKVGWLLEEGDDTLTSAAMFRKEPKTGTGGTLSWTVDVKNPATGDDFVLFVKELEMPDGTRRPYSVWFAGEYPKAFDGLCKLLSIDMRVIDPAWIGMKLRKLLNYKEPQGDFLAKVPGSEKQQNFPSTIAYIARLLLHRYAQLGILDEDGRVGGGAEPAFAGEAPKYRAAGRECPECGVKALIKYNGCDKCTNCGYTGSCG